MTLSIICVASILPIPRENIYIAGDSFSFLVYNNIGYLLRIFYTHFNYNLLKKSYIEYIIVGIAAETYFKILHYISILDLFK